MHKPQQMTACRQDTVVKDPFYEKVPEFFNMSLKELYSVKHPTAWVEFEKERSARISSSANFSEMGGPLTQRA